MVVGLLWSGPNKVALIGKLHFVFVLKARSPINKPYLQQQRAPWQPELSCVKMKLGQRLPSSTRQQRLPAASPMISFSFFKINRESVELNIHSCRSAPYLRLDTVLVFFLDFYTPPSVWPQEPWWGKASNTVFELSKKVAGVLWLLCSFRGGSCAPLVLKLILLLVCGLRGYLGRIFSTLDSLSDPVGLCTHPFLKHLEGTLTSRWMNILDIMILFFLPFGTSSVIPHFIWGMTHL